MEQGRVHLVVGAAGMIGGALSLCLRASSERVVAADLWREGLSHEKTYLNLESDSSEWTLPRRIKTAYICSGVTGIEECRRDPAGSFRVNVEGTLNLTDILINNGAFIVFLSSNQVFDGTTPNVPALHPQNPANEYGRQKAAVERVLNQWPDQSAIVRLTKVVGPGSIFSEWARTLNEGRTIHPFSDMVVSPVPLATVVSVLKFVGDLQLGGIWQISGEQDVRYSDAAFLGGKVLGIDLNLIQPWSTSDAGLDLEVNPGNTTMDTERLRQDLGLIPPSVHFTVENAFVADQKNVIN